MTLFSDSNNVRKGFLEHDEFLAVRKNLPAYLYTLVTLAYKSGWRSSEIRNLTWAQVDRQNWSLRLHSGDTKNDEGRVFFLDQELIDLFKEQWRTRQLGCGYVFHRQGKQIVNRHAIMTH